MPLSKHMLYPADIYVDGSSSRIVSTVLGSCISVCLYDTVLQKGAINHFMLPYWNGIDLDVMKYGNLSTIHILEELIKAGSEYKNIVAKVYGGAEVLADRPTNFHIGQRNIQVAHEILNEFQIPIITESTGGKKGRIIEFNTQTGEVVERFVHGRNDNPDTRKIDWFNYQKSGNGK